jgi:hypothetical protein
MVVSGKFEEARKAPDLSGEMIKKGLRNRFYLNNAGGKWATWKTRIFYLKDEFLFYCQDETVRVHSH